jgi:hypothetical protein
MSRRRFTIFVLMYGVIVMAMLFVYLFVQKEYGADPTKPYQRRFLLQLPLLERADSRLSRTGYHWIILSRFQGAATRISL